MPVFLVGSVNHADPRQSSLALIEDDVAVKQVHVLNFDGVRENKRVPAPWVPPVKSATDAQNFEGEDYGPDKRVAPYTGDGAWYDDF